MTRAVILLEEGWQDEEGIFSYHRMIEESWHVDVATPAVRKKYGEVVNELPKMVYGKFGVPLKVTVSTESLRVQDYDVVVIPGGFVSPDMLRMRLEVLDFVNNMHQYGKLVAMQCHGVWVGISANIMYGKRASCYASLKADLINAGGIYVAESVVEDGNIITADHYKRNGPFMRAVIQNRVENEYLESLKRAS